MVLGCCLILRGLHVRLPQVVAGGWVFGMELRLVFTDANPESVTQVTR